MVYKVKILGVISYMHSCMQREVFEGLIFISTKKSSIMEADYTFFNLYSTSVLAVGWHLNYLKTTGV